MSLRDTILGADDLKKEVVEVPEWNATILLREMSGVGRNQLYKLVAFDKDNRADLVEMWAAALVLSARDPESGALIFTPDDMPALQDKNGDVLARIGKRALDLAGLGPNSKADAEKNLDSDTPNEDSTSV